LISFIIIKNYQKMVVDEVFHDDDYGHYLDLDCVEFIPNDFYKANLKRKPIEIEKDESTTSIKGYINKIEMNCLVTHVFYLCIIGYLSYSLLFKKL
jgi:hypothetical protein